MTRTPKNQSSVLILASASPRRKKLLQIFDIPFRVQPSTVAENIDQQLPPSEIVEELALRKARDIAKKSKNAVIIGADTIVVHEGQILGKPQNTDHAKQLLHSLSNSTHEVFTGVALIKTDGNAEIERECTFAESTEVTFGNLDPSAIDNYVAGGKPMDKAGAYGIQDDWGAVFVKRIKGDYYTIVGLPVHALYNQLKDFTPELFELIQP